MMVNVHKEMPQSKIERTVNKVMNKTRVSKSLSLEMTLLFKCKVFKRFPSDPACLSVFCRINFNTLLDCVQGYYRECPDH